MGGGGSDILKFRGHLLSSDHLKNSGGRRWDPCPSYVLAMYNVDDKNGVIILSNNLTDNSHMSNMYWNVVLLLMYNEIHELLQTCNS